MEGPMDLMNIFSLFWWIIPLLLLAALYKLVLRVAFGAVIVPQDRLAIVTKKYALFGAHRSLPDGKIIALKDEAGIQADTLGPGLHWGLWPWQYQTQLEEFTTIPEGQ